MASTGQRDGAASLGPHQSHRSKTCFSLIFKCLTPTESPFCSNGDFSYLRSTHKAPSCTITPHLVSHTDRGGHKAPEEKKLRFLSKEKRWPALRSYEGFLQVEASRQLTAGASRLGTAVTCPGDGNTHVPPGSHLTHHIYAVQGRDP